MKILKFILSGIWILIGLVVGSAFFSWSYQFSSSSFNFFLFNFVFLSFIISILILAPLLLFFKKWLWKLLLFSTSVILLSFFFVNSTGIFYFIPPIPIYPGGNNVKYKYQKSGMGEMDANELSLQFSVSKASDIDRRKEIAAFYERELSKRGWGLSGSFSNSSVSCAEEIDKSQKSSLNHPLCPIDTGKGRFDLSFSDDRVTFYLFSK